jgi:CMP-N-acetylneuraminic acid synthetase
MAEAFFGLVFLFPKEGGVKVVCMIPIKLNNERAPGKNTRQFSDGTPLLTYCVQKLSRLEGLDRVYCFCSNAVVEKYLPEDVVFLQRPEYLDTQDATPQDILKEFTLKIDADVYMVSHVTSPFVTMKHLEECIKAVVENGFDSAFTGERIQKLLWRDGTPLNFDAEEVPRTQDLVPIFAENSAAYVFKKEVFQRLNRRIGTNSHITEISGFECVDIDYPEDFMLADLIYQASASLCPPPPCYVIRYRSSKWLKRSLVSSSFSQRRAA